DHLRSALTAEQQARYEGPHGQIYARAECARVLRRAEQLGLCGGVTRSRCPGAPSRQAPGAAETTTITEPSQTHHTDLSHRAQARIRATRPQLLRQWHLVEGGQHYATVEADSHASDYYWQDLA